MKTVFNGLLLASELKKIVDVETVYISQTNFPALGHYHFTIAVSKEGLVIERNTVAVFKVKEAKSKLDVRLGERILNQLPF